MEQNKTAEFLKVVEIKNILRVGDRQARRWLKENGLYFRIGNSIRVPRGKLEKCLNHKISEEAIQRN